MAPEGPAGNGNWDLHRMHVIGELKRATVERDALGKSNARQHKDICDALADLKTELAVQRTRIDLRSGIFGLGGGGVLIAFVEVIKLIVSQGGK